MYKVIIADDEPGIRNGLRVLIPWEQYQFTSIHTAANGKEAVELYKADGADLMIVDIRMPEMDGLQLIRTIREEDSDINFIVLSGYAEFDYAHQAITYKVNEYILKPVDEEELERSLRKITEKLKLRREEKLLHVKERHWRKSQWVLRALEMRPQETGRPEELEAAAESLGMLWPQYQAALISFEEEQNKEQLSLLQQEMDEQLQVQGAGIAVVLRSQIGLLLNRAYENESELMQLYQKTASMCTPKKIRFTVTAGGIVYSPKQIVSSYMDAEQLLKHRFFLEDEGAAHAKWRPSDKKVLAAHQTESKWKEHPTPELQDLTDKLYYSLVIDNITQAAALLRQAGAHMLNEHYTEQQMKAGFVRLLTAVNIKMNRTQAESGSKEDHFSQLESIMRLYHEPSLNSLYQSTEQLLKQFASGFDTNRPDVLVNRMVHLIELHCNESLRLETLAEVFNYNSAYLGKLFKNHTGEFFNTFLDRVRIERAKELLLAGEKVYHVAEQVGYANVDYFHSKFKKYVNVSPTAYRRKYRPEQENDGGTGSSG